MVVGYEPGQPGEPGYLVAGRHITRSHYEAVADVRTGFVLGERIRIRRHDYTVVGLTRRMVSSGGDPMVFIPLKDAQEAQFLKDNDAILNERERTAANPAFNRPGVPGLLEAVQASQASSRSVNAVLVQVQPGLSAEAQASLDEFIAGMASGDINVWTGPINLQDGTEYVADGAVATDDEVWYLPQLLEEVLKVELALAELLLHLRSLLCIERSLGPLD